MDFLKFNRRIYSVEAVQITDENMKYICSFIGIEIVENDGNPYIVAKRSRIKCGKSDRLFKNYWIVWRDDGLIYSYSPNHFNNKYEIAE
jgi:hypothetical protein